MDTRAQAATCRIVADKSGAATTSGDFHSSYQINFAFGYRAVILRVLEPCRAIVSRAQRRPGPHSARICLAP
jgi:hypothetical protein